MIKELVLATHNSGKIKELTTLLAPINCIPQRKLQINEAAETGLSFIENALIKARHASLMAKKPALADDSGLVVPSLQGEPGIFSARYAGENKQADEHIDLLLARLKDAPSTARQAYFYCAIALVKEANDPTPLISVGQINGFITDKRAGLQGFGYDPIFYVPEQQCTMAELSPAIKNRISHRAIALHSLLNALLLTDTNENHR